MHFSCAREVLTDAHVMLWFLGFGVFSAPFFFYSLLSLTSSHRLSGFGISFYPCVVSSFDTYLCPPAHPDFLQFYYIHLIKRFCVFIVFPCSLCIADLDSCAFGCCF